jgi:hypothetical protein
MDSLLGPFDSLLFHLIRTTMKPLSSTLSASPLPPKKHETAILNTTRHTVLTDTAPTATYINEF